MMRVDELIDILERYDPSTEVFLEYCGRPSAIDRSVSRFLTEVVWQDGSQGYWDTPFELLKEEDSTMVIKQRELKALVLLP